MTRFIEDYPFTRWQWLEVGLLGAGDRPLTYINVRTPGQVTRFSPRTVGRRLNWKDQFTQKAACSLARTWP